MKKIITMILVIFEINCMVFANNVVEPAKFEFNYNYALNKQALVTFSDTPPEINIERFYVNETSLQLDGELLDPMLQPVGNDKSGPFYYDFYINYVIRSDSKTDLQISGTALSNKEYVSHEKLMALPYEISFEGLDSTLVHDGQSQKDAPAIIVTSFVPDNSTNYVMGGSIKSKFTAGKYPYLTGLDEMFQATLTVSIILN